MLELMSDNILQKVLVWDTVEFPQSFYWQAFYWWCSWSVSTWKATSGATSCFSSSVLINFWWKLESLMGNSKVLGGLLSSVLLDNKSLVFQHLKIFIACLCRLVGWLCVVVDVWYCHKQLSSLSVASRTYTALPVGQLTSQMVSWLK